MSERIFTLKGVNEIPAKWTGVTIPMNIPDYDATLSGVVAFAGAENAYTLWARAQLLDWQKDVKAFIQKNPDATVEQVRAHAAGYPERVKAAQLRLRDPNAEPKAASSGVVKAAKQAKSTLETMLEENPEFIPKYWDRLTDDQKVRFAAHAPTGAIIPTLPAAKPAAEANGADAPATEAKSASRRRPAATQQ